MENTTQIKLPACSSGQSLGQCIAVIRLFEQGTIVSLTDQLGAYMTSLSNGSWNQAWSSIQINQLLAMVSGIPDSSSEKLTYMEQLENLVETPLKFPAGTQYQYSNSNYFLLSALVDTLVGVSSSYIDYMRQQVLKVFNLPNTGLFTHATIDAT